MWKNTFIMFKIPTVLNVVVKLIVDCEDNNEQHPCYIIFSSMFNFIQRMS